ACMRRPRSAAAGASGSFFGPRRCGGTSGLVASRPRGLAARRRFARLARIATEAALEGLHEVDHLAAAFGRLGQYGLLALDLRLDELRQRVLIAVAEAGWLELADLLANQLTRQIEHLLFRLGVADLGEVATRVLH